MVLLSHFHSRYIAMLFFFHSVPQEVPRPQLTLSLLYPAKSLIQQLTEDNQCPSHLTLSSSLLLVSSLKGDQLIHFFHNNIAEASHSLISQIQILWGNFLDGCAVELTSEVSFAIPLVFQCCVVILTLYIPLFVLPVDPSLPVCALGSLEFVYLLWLC